jgi:MoaA/NifB/PqqE/SkfB family radical SAM enzyme
VHTLIKISGGLEPMTDPGTMCLILEQAQLRGIRSKLFTNGLLLNTPDNRELALRASDVRISLNVLSEQEFGYVMFGTDGPPQVYGLSSLLNNLRNLVMERNQINLKTKIGINTIVLEENHRQMEGFVALARDLGVNYIDFKPNYFMPYLPRTQSRVDQTINKLRERCSPEDPDVFFAGSLFSENLFWTHRKGMCRPHKQSRFKLFITPFGHCSPVHHGAFPAHDGIMDNRFIAGQITPGCSLAEILSEMPNLPDIEYEKLNPFEHMLALEIDRNESDIAFGISKEYNPYSFHLASSLPSDIGHNPVLNQLMGSSREAQVR